MLKNKKLETRNQKLQTSNQNLETRNQKLGTSNLNQETRNEISQKLETRN